MMEGHQVAFLNMLIAAMLDATKEKKLTQIKTQLAVNDAGETDMRVVRIIVVPEVMDFDWPGHAPLGSTGKDG